MYHKYLCTNSDGINEVYDFTDILRPGEYLLVPTPQWYKVVRVIGHIATAEKPLNMIALQKLDVLNEDTSG